MRTLAGGLATKDVVGDPITTPWWKLDRVLSLHTKELVVVAAAPTAGKSVFAINLALSAEHPVLYVSQDSTPSVMARMAALLLGENTGDVYDALRDEDTRDEIVDELRDERPGLIISDGAVTFERLSEMIEAMTEYVGMPPPLVVLDNLIDTVVPGHHWQDVGFYATILPQLKQLALQKNICFMALHHITRSGDGGKSKHGRGTRPLTMTDLLYSGEREAEHVLGIYHSMAKDKMHIQILKQRDGDADAEGGLEVELGWHPRQGRLTNR